MTGKNGSLDRRGPAPARQDRGMYVHAATQRDVEYRWRQQQSIGNHHEQIGSERAQFRLWRFGFECGRLQHGNAKLKCQLLYRARAELPAASCRPVGLGQHGDRAMAPLTQHPQRRRGKSR